MQYLVSRHGQTLGYFALEEIQRRRRAGEFVGDEWVWRDGLANWQPIDSVIGADTRGGPGKGAFWIVLGIVGAVCMGFALIAGYVFLKKTKAERRTAERSEGEAVMAPIVLKTNTPTAKQFRELGRQFRIRQWLDGYRDSGEHGPAWDEFATNLLSRWIENAHGQQSASSDTSLLSEWVAQLDTNNLCGDPLILVALGSCVEDNPTRVRRFERALELFPKSRHKAYPRFNAAVVLASCFSTNSGRIVPLEATALKHLEGMLTDGSVAENDQPIIADILVTGWGKDMFVRNSDRVCDILAKADPRYKWLALFMAGEREIKTAWKDRGGGFANTVSEKGWEGFGEHLGSARKSLEEAWRLHPEWPQAPTWMMEVALGSSGLEEMRLWFDRAVAAQVDYPDAWFKMRWGLRPRWHGSLDLMRDFGIEALKTGRFDMDIPGQFFDVVRDMEAELKLKPRQSILGRADIWPWTQKLYEGRIASGQTEDGRFGWRTAYVIAAYLGGKYDIARQQLEANDWKMRPANSTGWHVELSLLPEEIAARTSTLADEIQRAEAAYDRDDVETAFKAYTGCAARAGADERTARFIKHRLAELEQGLRLRKGEWLSFLPSSEDDLTWTTVSGSFKPLQGGGVEVHENKQCHMLYSRVRVRTGFVVKGEFEVLNQEPGRFQGGLVMGVPDLETRQWYSFRLCQKPDSGLATFAQAWRLGEIYQPVKLMPGRNSFEFTLRLGTVSAVVNGREVFREAKLPRRLWIDERDSFVGLCGYNGGSDKPAIRYYNVQLRSLPSQ